MPEDLSSYNLAAVRELLLAAFTANDLRGLFRYAERAALRPAEHEFAPAHGPAPMADKAIAYCHTRALLPDLLRKVRRANPRQYARCAGQLEG